MTKKCKGKYQRNIVSLIMLGIVCTLLLYAKPVAAIETSQLILTERIEQVQTFGEDIIVVKYRMYNGRYQRRRWNETKQKWVDPNWIDM